MGLYHEQNTDFNNQAGPASKTSANIATVYPGLLVVMAASENGSTASTMSVSNSGTALTWTQRYLNGGNPGQICWTAPVTSERTNMTVTVSIGSVTDQWGFQLWAYGTTFGNGSLGAVQGGTGFNTLPSVTLTTQGANSAICALFSDFSGTDNGTLTYSTINGSAGTQQMHHYEAGIQTVAAANWTDAGAAGNKTVAVTNATLDTQWSWTMVAVEVGDFGQSVNVGLVTQAAETAQTQQNDKKSVTLGQALEADQARPSKWLVDVGQATESSFADRAIWIGAVEVTPALRTVWLNVASNQQDRMSFPNMSALSVAKVKPGEVRRMVGGRDRLFTHEGMQRAVSATFPGCTREQVDWLEDHVGDLLCVRDDRGRKLYAAYSQVEVDELSTTTAYAHCSVALGEVTHTEVV